MVVMVGLALGLFWKRRDLTNVSVDIFDRLSVGDDKKEAVQMIQL